MDYLIELASNPTAWAALIALVLMEVILGIDNLIFISVVSNKLPEDQRSRARKIGLSAALLMRIILLSAIAMIIQLTEPVMTVMENEFSWRDLILIAGGLFLVWKATREIHHQLDPEPVAEASGVSVAAKGVMAAIVQILLLDMVFSVDSIITAVGMTPHVPIMVIAVVISIGVMFVAADPLANFIRNNPTIVMLALGFLLLIGTTLIAEGFGIHFPKGYIYTAMAFSILVESLNMMSRRARRP